MIGLLECCCWEQKLLFTQVYCISWLRHNCIFTNYHIEWQARQGGLGKGMNVVEGVCAWFG